MKEKKNVKQKISIEKMILQNGYLFVMNIYILELLQPMTNAFLLDLWLRHQLRSGIKFTALLTSPT